MFASKVVRVLSIDGGGIRGIIPSMILNELEKLTGKPIHKLFDLIAGTSTGGIISLGLTKPNENGEAAYTAAKLIEFYEQEGPKIFQADLWYRSKSIGNLVGPKYSGVALEAVLKTYFADTGLHEALTPVIITAYEIERRLAWFFKSRQAKNDTERNFLMREVARATSAAPTYFPPTQIKASGSNDYYSFVDGGVFANNPGMCAFVEAKKMFPGADEIILVSLGTGFLTNRISYEEAKNWGLANWAQPILNVVLDGIDDTVDYHLSKLVPPTKKNTKNYYRFQTMLSEGNQSLDAANAENIRTLRLVAEEVIRTAQPELQALAKRLTKK